MSAIKRRRPPQHGDDSATQVVVPRHLAPQAADTLADDAQRVDAGNDGRRFLFNVVVPDTSPRAILLVTFEPEAAWSLLDHERMEQELTEASGRKVDRPLDVQG